MARAIVSQEGQEAFFADSDSDARVTQYGVEAFYAWDPTTVPGTVVGAAVSQYGIEAFYAPSDAAVHVSQYGVEAFFAPDDVAASAGGGTHTSGSFG